MESKVTLLEREEEERKLKEETVSKKENNISDEESGSENDANTIEEQSPETKKVSKKVKCEDRYILNFGSFETRFEWLPLEILTEIFLNLNTRDLLACGLVCKRWCEATQYYKLPKKTLLHFSIFRFTDNSYPIDRFLNCTRFFPNLKFSIVKFVPKNDLFWTFYGDVIEELTFNSCIINKPEFLRIIRNTRFLRSLTIVRCEDLYKSWSIVKNSNQVKLRFKYMKSLAIQETSTLTKSILDFLFVSAPHLTSITLSSCFGNTKPRDRALMFNSLVEYLINKAQQIKVLNLLNTHCDDLFLEQLSRIKNLELDELHLSFNGTISANFHKTGLIMLFQNQKNLKFLDLTDSKGLNNACLAEICKYMKSLKKLMLNRCWMINDVGLKEVSRLLHLEVLDITSCDRITDFGLMEGLIPQGRKFLNLKELYLGLLPYMSINSIYRLAQQFDNLEVLDLSGSSNSITDEALHMIFRYQPKLKYINFDCCGKLTDYGVTGSSENIDEYVPYSINSLKNLEFVNFGGCYQITDKSLVKSFDLCNLREISLARCHNITEKGIASLVKKCPLLEIIDLSEAVHITDECIDIITSQVFRLTTLKLNGCVQLTDETLYLVEENCKYLKNLYIRRCNKIIENPFDIIKSVRYIYNQ